MPDVSALTTLLPTTAVPNVAPVAVVLTAANVPPGAEGVVKMLKLSVNFALKLATSVRLSVPPCVSAPPMTLIWS